MDDSPPDGPPPPETPIQKAMRLKRAAHAAKSAPKSKGWADAERAAAAKSSSKSKPWTTR